MAEARVLALVLALASCGAPEPETPVRRPPDGTLVERPARPAPPPLPAAVTARRDELLAIAADDSLRRLARLAEADARFLSNFAGASHYDHWELLRRVGVDPLRNLAALFGQPHAMRGTGEETWYVWPDFAVMEPDELLPERLGVQDRARLVALVGEDGIADIRAGRPYPGVRTAISSEGRWVYFLHQADQSEGEQ